MSSYLFVLLLITFSVCFSDDNIDMIRYSVNTLKGRTPYEQRIDLDNALLFDLTSQSGSIPYTQLSQYQRTLYRRFNFLKCEPYDINTHVTNGNLQIIGETNWDEEWDFRCDGNKVLTQIDSEHNDGKDDRKWTFGCINLNGLKLDDCQKDNDYRNSYDEYFMETCNSGQVLSGLSSIHDNDSEDRRFKFICCSLVYDNNNYIDTYSDSNFGSYVNDYQEYFYESNNGKVLTGLSSIHSNAKDDRKFKFKYGGVTNVETSGWEELSITSLDGTWTRDCSNGYFITDIETDWDDSSNDRWFKFYCKTYNNIINEPYSCKYTPYINEYDEEFDFTCGDDYAIAGISSTHKNSADDRKYKFKCCRLAVEE